MANLGYIQVTRLCNQKCRMCSNPEREATLTFEQATALIDDFVSRHYDGIILTGGEPTMHPQLGEIIGYAKARGMASRIITNGQKTCDLDFIRGLVENGLTHLHVSIQSYDPKIQAFLSGKEDSLENAFKTLENVEKCGITADVNTTINHYNAAHLDKTVAYLIRRFPFLHHFVWNNLDPSMNRATENPDVIHELWEMEVPLYRAMMLLHATGRTFRAEKVPLCYMAEFAWASTESRKIIKGEERIVRFLDEKGMVRETAFRHGKAECCQYCTFDGICAGLFDMDVHYKSSELYPVFLDPEPIRQKVLSEP
ncbi:MAG TPA: radical SAM protein [Myxococcota bacterium]|nr:radical SAM protein [Myxococcota bacterium]HPV04167.1 radical SAM protein [Myxococcota bacterium]